MARNAQKRILEVAQPLFLKFGWNRVTVDEICKKTGVTRKTFYTYYNNKTDLAIAVLNIIIEDSLEECMVIFNNTAISFGEKLKQTMIFKMDFAQRASVDFFQDFILTNDPEIMAFIARNRQKNEELFIELFEQAKKLGEVRENLNIDMVLAITTHLETLYVDPAFQRHFCNMANLVENVSEFLIYGMITKDN